MSYQGKVCIQANCGPSGRSLAWSDWQYFHSPLDGMLVHNGVNPSIKFAGNHLYTWVEWGNVRVKCLAQNITQCPRPGLEPGPLPSRDKCTNWGHRASHSVIRQVISLHHSTNMHWDFWFDGPLVLNFPDLSVLIFKKKILLVKTCTN